MISIAIQDIRLAMRRAISSPGYTLATVMTIALGIGLATGGFSAVSGLLFRDLPVPDSHELLTISRQRVSPGGETTFRNPAFTAEEYEIFRNRSEAFDGLASFSLGAGLEAILDDAGQTEILGAAVSCNYFNVLRQIPSVGRGLIAADCESGAPPVMIIGHELWETGFDGDPSVVGESVILSMPGPSGWVRSAFTVVGIASEETYNMGGGRAAFFAPYAAIPGGDATLLGLIGRRNQDVDPSRVGAELDVIANDLELRRAELEANDSIPLASIKLERARRFSMANTDAVSSAVGFMVPFALILLIVCANVANLMLARTTDRRREIAMRLSLGASRSRVLRQLLTESALIALAGGALGAVIAFASFDTLFALVMSYVPDPRERLMVDLAIDARVLLFAFLLSLVTGVLCGVIPASKLTGLDLNTAMKHDSIGADGRPASMWQSTFVGIQVAVCIVLMVLSGLFLRDFYVTNAGVDPGFDYHNVLVAQLLPPRDARDSPDDLSDQAIREIRSLPGVDSVAWTSYAPWGDAPEVLASIPGQGQSWVNSISVSAEYFEALGTPIVRGQTFSGTRAAPEPATAIVSESMARFFWGQDDPVGEILTVSARSLPSGDEQAAIQIIGVASDAELESIGDTTMVMYRSSRPRVGEDLLLIRGRASAASLQASVRDRLSELGPGIDARVWSLEDSFALFRYQSRFTAAVTFSVGALATSLAAIGIWGVVAYVVGRRRREIGIRLALGARPGNVMSVILRRTMRPVIAGALIGTAAIVIAGPLLRELLISVGWFDAIGIGSAIAFVLLVGIVASAIPARRCLRIDPMTALRYE